jgi:hypothetical protein
MHRSIRMHLEFLIDCPPYGLEIPKQMSLTEPMTSGFSDLLRTIRFRNFLTRKRWDRLTGCVCEHFAPKDTAFVICHC